jgi:magnesium transporter
MQSIEEEKKQDVLVALLESGELTALLSFLKEMPIVEVVEFLRVRPVKEVAGVLKMLQEEDQGKILSRFLWDLQYSLFLTMEPADYAIAFSNMYSDRRADLFKRLTPKEQGHLLPFLDKGTRENVISLSSYPSDTAGGIMQTDFATIMLSMTIREAIDKIRKDAPSRQMVFYIYVVDEQMRLQGFVALKDLILQQPDVAVADIVRKSFVSAHVYEDREKVAVKIEHYDLVAIPVLNDEGQLLGVVNYDDAMDVIRAEHTEDMEKFMGIVPGEESVSYIETPILQHFKKRIVWLAGLAALGIISGLIIHRFENTLNTLIILALYMPMMADTGGNTGSQAATVVIRAMALGEIGASNWIRVLWKELRISLLVSVCLGVLAFGKIFFLSYESELPAQYTLMMVALVITLALCLQVVTATLIGAALPLVVKRVGGDPAVAASPAITTVVDITGMLIYFGIATWLLL